MTERTSRTSVRAAWRFVLAMGLVAFLGDLGYEGMRALVGPYLELLGTSAAVVGFVAGLGELAGYALRWAFGWLADRKGWHWRLTFLGYGTMAVAIAALAWVRLWWAAAALIVVERLAKAIRSPARAAIVAGATTHTGHGRGFGVDELLDQAGAVVGPLLAGGVLGLTGGAYREAFLVLAIPAAATLGVLHWARRRYVGVVVSTPTNQAPRSLVPLLVVTTPLALGFADWALAAYHLVAQGQWSAAHAAFLYALAMGVDGVAAPLLGELFDRWGLTSLAVAVAAAAAGQATLFLGAGVGTILVGAVLWGIAMGGVEVVLKAAVGRWVAPEHRAGAYGRLFAVYGLAWWLGSWGLGLLYQHLGPGALVTAATLVLALALALLPWARRRLV